MTVLHGPSGVGIARRRLRSELQGNGAAETIIDDAMLILSELLSNSYRHARPLDGGQLIRADWQQDSDGSLTISVTDGGGPTRPRLSSPSISARGGRGLTIITSLCRSWGVREAPVGSAVTVWAVLQSSGG
ncbi:ATP-binding protein [Streptomyces profundus]|uniref:ATP-binding protein n=1 Tax=Streptomyces profundus TaxID=2867410 RepID=UPI001D16CD13|nr:ATP-binding protein [Streptomyces sp. MA3_2.13]